MKVADLFSNLNNLLKVPEEIASTVEGLAGQAISLVTGGNNPIAPAVPATPETVAPGPVSASNPPAAVHAVAASGFKADVLQGLQDAESAAKILLEFGFFLPGPYKVAIAEFASAMATVYGWVSSI